MVINFGPTESFFFFRSVRGQQQFPSGGKQIALVQSFKTTL